MPASTPPELRVHDDDLSGAEIRELLSLHARGMQASSPQGACHFLDLDGLGDPSVTVWSFWAGAELAGCGALREIDGAHGEVKSMRTAPEHLGRGSVGSCSPTSSKSRRPARTGV